MSVSLHHAQKLAARLPPLLIEAERVAVAIQQGVHGRRRAGVGETFWQFRRYEPGDPADRIDWRQSARTDRVFIREKEWEAAQTAYLWADQSGSMRYASQKNLPAKAERAQLLMLALASLLVRGGEKIIWLERDAISVRNKSGLENLAGRLEQPGLISQNEPPDIAVARHAHMVLCSDFLMPPDGFKRLIRRYAASAIRGVLVHILDPAEEDFTFQGRLEMLGCEGETPLLLPNAAALHAAYRQRMTEHKTRLEHIARSAGWFYTRHVTVEPPQRALLRIYQILSCGEATSK